MVEFKVVKMYRLQDAGNLKAFADVSINDAVIIRGVRLVDGKKGLFVSMPKEQGKDNKWYDQVEITNTETYDKFNSVVIGFYNEHK